MSAFEVTLADARADEAHPAFSNLFVQCPVAAAHQALVFERKPRLATEQGLHVAHFLADTEPQVMAVRLQTDRQRWLGRNRSASSPLASFDAAPSAQPDGTSPGIALDTGLDPVCALAVRLRIAPNAKARLTFATAACRQRRASCSAVIDKYRQTSHVQRASLMSATLTRHSPARAAHQRRKPRRHPDLDHGAAAVLDTPARRPGSRRGSTAATSAIGGCCGAFGISGDRPLILVSAGVTQGLGLLRSLAQALRWWSWGGVGLRPGGGQHRAGLVPDAVAARDRCVARAPCERSVRFARPAPRPPVFTCCGPTTCRSTS